VDEWGWANGGIYELPEGAISWVRNMINPLRKMNKKRRLSRGRCANWQRVNGESIGKKSGGLCVDLPLAGSSRLFPGCNSPPAPPIPQLGS
jgi:hypothetical protein